MQKVEKYLEKNIDKIITTFIWIQPIIDVLTAIMLHNNMSFTIGIIIRIAFLLFMVFYLLISTKNKKKYLIYLSITFIYIVFYALFSKSKRFTNTTRSYYHCYICIICKRFVPVVIICHFTTPYKHP